MKKLNQYKLIVFDLDGTLAASKQPITDKMAVVFCRLLGKKQVAVISGGKFTRFQKQLLEHLPCREYFKKLTLCPVNAAEMYKFTDNNWKAVYQHALSNKEKENIKQTIQEAMQSIKLHHSHVPHGEIVEDRGAQITLSALGQQAPLEEKRQWNSKYDNVRAKLSELLGGKLPDFQVSVGGLTSIDITQSGLDKGYGIEQIQQILKVPLEDMLFIGDAIYPEGNDYAATETGVDYIAVRDPQETRKQISRLVD